MYGMRSESIRVRRSRSPAAAAARASARENLSALLEHNMKIARVIAYETSPLRILTRHAYKNALIATRRLTGDIGKMKRSARTSCQKTMLQQLEVCLRQSRINAMVKSVSVSVAQDVFVLLSHYLGLCSVPEKSVFDGYAARARATVAGVQPGGGGAARMSEKGVPVRGKQERVWFRRSVSHKQHMHTSLSTQSIGSDAYSPPPPVSYLSMPNVLAVAQKRKLPRAPSVKIQA